MAKIADLGVIGNISIDDVIYDAGSRFSFVGGAALHISVAAAHAGLVAAPISVVGHDLEWCREDLRRLGVLADAVVVEDGASCRFAIRYGSDGTVTEVESRYGVSARLTAHALSQIGAFGQYHVSCRQPLDVAEVLATLDGVPYSLDFFASSARMMMGDARARIRTASMVFVNQAEFGMLIDVVGLGVCECVVATDGPRPARVLRRGTVTASVTPSVVEVVEVTGAGDALAGTFIAAIAAGASDVEALSQAVNVATLAVQRVGGLSGLIAD